MPHANLAEPLAQMLRSISLQKRTGLLRVEQLGEGKVEQGEIYFEAGRPKNARIGQETGKTALKRISTWKHITCSFTGMSRPYPGNALASSPVSEQPKAETSQHAMPTMLRQTGNLTRTPLPLPPGQEKRQDDSGQAFFSGEISNTFSASSLRSGGPVTSTNLRTSTSPYTPLQPLVVRGHTLEEFIPTPPPAFPRSVQRWTTHQLPGELERAGTLPGKPPSTPPPDLLPGGGPPPGRMAVFKARAMVTTAQSINQMERRERIIFILLDGARTIQDLARLTHHTESEVEQILLDLTNRGYTEYLPGPAPVSSIHTKMVDLFTRSTQEEGTYK